MFKMQMCLTKADFQQSDDRQVYPMGVWYDCCGGMGFAREDADAAVRCATEQHKDHPAGPIYRVVPVDALDEMPGDPIIPEVRNV